MGVPQLRDLPVSDREYTEMREDEIARLITAREEVGKLRKLADVLCKRGAIEPDYYHDMRNTLTIVDSALLLGKHAVATLRNGRGT